MLALVIAGAANGWMVNPINGDQSWDSRARSYDATLMPPLPYTASAGQSIARAISHVGGCSAFGPTCIDEVVVLTVLAWAALRRRGGSTDPGFR